MQKKKINTALIIAVILIWGGLLYKFVAPYFTEKEPVLTADALVKKPLIINKKKDTIILNFPDRDPFLGRITTPRKTIKVPSSTRSTSKPKTALKKQPWPEIKYLGFVKSKNSKNRLGLLRIDGKLHRVNNNMTVGTIKIKSINKDEVIVRKGKEERSFKRS